MILTSQVVRVIDCTLQIQMGKMIHYNAIQATDFCRLNIGWCTYFFEMAILTNFLMAVLTGWYHDGLFNLLIKQLK